MWQILWLPAAHHILFLLNRFSVKYRFPFPIKFYVLYRNLNYLELLKDWFLKKILLKRAKTRRLFFPAKLYSQIIENNFFRFLR